MLGGLFNEMHMTNMMPWMMGFHDDSDEPGPVLTWVALAELVEDVFEAERLASREDHIVFVADIPTGLTLRADPEQMHRVLGNLVRNARQALMAAGGRIDVRAEERDTAWIIEVRDDGPGLPPRAREHLFVPFQGGARKGGSGLGLSIAAELVRGLGGQLTLVDSGPRGTTFAITLPRGDDAL